jgi:hypothetical protein
MAIGSESNYPPVAANSAAFVDFGRPLDPEWFENFKVRLSEVTRGHKHRYLPPTIPGLVYLLPREQAAASKVPGILEGVSSTAEATDRILRANILKKQIALHGLSVHVNEIDTAGLHKSRPHVRLRARVEDMYSSIYSGFILQEERRACTVASGATRPQPTTERTIPRHHVGLGSIILPPGVIDRAFLTALNESPYSEAELGPVGSINSLLEHTSS